MRLRVKTARNARPHARAVPAVRPARGVLRRAGPDLLQRVRDLGPVHVARGQQPARQRVRGGGGDRYTHGQHEDEIKDGVLQLNEPRVERDIHIPRAVRRPRFHPVRRRRIGLQPHARATRRAAQVHALRVPSREHAHHTQPAAAAHRAVRVHAVHGQLARRTHQPPPGLGYTRARRGKWHRAPLRADAQAQDVLRDGVRRVLREHIRHVQGDAGQHCHGRHQTSDRKAGRERRRDVVIRAARGGGPHLGRAERCASRRFAVVVMQVWRLFRLCPKQTEND